jgi:hypothetical protein
MKETGSLQYVLFRYFLMSKSWVVQAVGIATGYGLDGQDVRV